MPNLDLVVPDLGGPEECLVVTWLKRPGDAVKAGDALVILQAEKVSFEIPAPASGHLGALQANQGDVVRVGQVLAALAASALPETAAPPPAYAEQPPPAATSPGQAAPASPAAKRLAREHGIDLAGVRGSGPDGRISEKDVEVAVAARQAAAREAPASPAAAATGARAEGDARVSPLARRLAREHGIDLATISGSGGGGRITEKDVQAAIDARRALGPAAAAIQPVTEQTIALAGMRQAIARRMHESLQSMAQLTLHTEADVTERVAQHAQRKAAGEDRITYTDLIVHACAAALRQHPLLNATLRGETIHLLPAIHIGVAVALEGGLVVPVIRNADRLDLAGLAAERQRLVDRARGGRLTSEEMSGSTFTITNLGGYGIDWFTPIVNPPEVAILGVGRIKESIVVRGGKIAQRHLLGLSLTIDHRVVDGAPGAAFLQTVVKALEE